MEIKQSVGPYLSELQGYLVAFPPVEHESDHSYNVEQIRAYHQLIDDIQKITSDDYSRFKVNIKHTQGSPTREYILINEFRMKLQGLVNFIQSKIFHDGDPIVANEARQSAIQVNQNQYQSQSQLLQLVLNTSELINQKLNTAQEGSPEKSFLQKLKGKLSSVKDSLDLTRLILTIGAEVGLNIDKLQHLFK